MKARSLAIVVAFCGIIALAWADSRDGLWKEVDDAVKKGLPKTAVEKLEPIIAGAIKDKAYDEAVKAIAQKISLETPKISERIPALEKEIGKVPAEMKPLMTTILAKWYWNYFQQNRWRFLNRTATAAPPGNDFTTWSLPRIFAEIDKQFETALKAEKDLKTVPVAKFAKILEKGTTPDSYRPTVYDFIVYEAIEFYASGEQAGARPQDAFELSAEDPIFGDAEGFLAWKPKTTDKDAPTLKAILLYQKLLKFHENDADKSAFLDANLARLKFGWNKAFGEEKNARYKAAVKRFETIAPKHPITVRAIAELASVIYNEGDRFKARDIALKGLAIDADSVGGRMCHNLVKQIEAPNARVHTDRVWNAPWPKVRVNYRNLKQIHFRVVPFDFEAHVKKKRWGADNLNHLERLALLSKDPVKTWSQDLPETKDFEDREEEISVPEDIKPGSYYLLSSHQKDFSPQDNLVQFTEIWVSDLALVIRTHYGDGILEGFVLNAQSGEPITNAKVRGWQYNRNQVTEIDSVKTDKNGLFRFPAQNRNSVNVLAEANGHSLATTNYHYVQTYDVTPKPFERTVFFTDRALYRPGQTIRFKGICVRVDQNGNSYKVIPGRQFTVALRDPNGKDVEKFKVKTNDYGSFSGSVTAPRDRLLGKMWVRVEDGPAGYGTVRVEEYKRPKFRVEVNAPEAAPRLNETIKLTGKATAYTGAAIDGAKVRYRVVREIRYPIWWGWRCWWMPQNSNRQEIAHGTTTTNANGTFELSFTAKPDLSVSKENEPTFQYTITADVIDTTGETRSGDKTVRVGYTALKATLSTEPWQTAEEPVKIAVGTTTLDGEGQSAKGTVKIYRLKQPDEVARPELSGQRYVAAGSVKAGDDPPYDPANPDSWPLGEEIFTKDFETNASGSAIVEASLKAGIYRVTLETQDRFGTPVKAVMPLKVLDPDAKKFAIRIPNYVAAPKWSLEPGSKFQAVWGSGYQAARAYIEIEHRGQILNSYWTPAGATQVNIEWPVDEQLRGGFQLRITMVRENRAYITSRKIQVPWSNKQLTVKWERFVSKLKPGQEESWTAIISGPDAQKAAVELVAGMYDASLDAYAPHAWQSMFNVFFQDSTRVSSQFENRTKYLQHAAGGWNIPRKSVSLTYRHLPDNIVQLWGLYSDLRGGGGLVESAPEMMEQATMNRDASKDSFNGVEAKSEKKRKANDKSAGGESGTAPDFSNVSARKNLNETAFFFPHLTTGTDGSARLEFTMPEALTEWKFLGFAHDQELRAGLLTDTVVTAKDLMVQPNPPRFVREGDEIEFTVKVSNQSPTRQTGTVRLTFADARTGKSVDAKLNNTSTDQIFEIAAGASTSLSWKISIPDSLGFLTYKAVGSTGRLSDGEEGYLPVLSRRLLVRESLPLPIRGKDTKNYKFDRLLKSADSKTIEHKSLTVQMVSNPSWYAVLSLPYLMEYPHECNEQTFNRLYANSLARHVANSDPKIRRVFDLWKAEGGDTLQSPLEQNDDLKSVMLEETPWVRQADNESQARRNIGILFDENRLNQETARLLRKLADQQYADGRWSWFPGGPANDYITLYITTGFGRMRHLGVDVDVSSAVKSLKGLDAWATRIYEKIAEDKRDKNHLTTTIALYLYGRSFFLADQPVAKEHQTAVNYWIGQAKTYWLQLNSRQSQGHLALALSRFDHLDAAKGVVASLKERSRTDEELGMYWPEDEASWWWYRAPIETQAVMIEAFDEVAADVESVEDCKVWLLKQKQTQDWKTTKATADAVYALLLRGSNLLASDALVTVKLGKQTIEPQDVEAGTGFYEQRFTGPEIDPAQGKIQVKKVDDGVAWGSVHWQYLEDIANITPYEGTPLKLSKSLYVKTHTKAGPVLEPVKGAVNVGDELVVRVVLKTDRAMEYVHLKDYRGSGTEPVNVLSKYRYQDGLAYYESTRDTASHFFIDYLPKGTYVFEYSVRVQLKGEYQTGHASIECMYAPEFNSHSQSHGLVVK